MIRHADKVPHFELSNAGFFLDFASRTFANVLAIFQMTLWKVPEPAAANEQVVSSSIAHKTASGDDLFESTAYLFIYEFGVVRGNINPGDILGTFHHFHERKNVGIVESKGIGVGESLLGGSADDDAPTFEIYLSHIANFVGKVKPTLKNIEGVLQLFSNFVAVHSENEFDITK